MTGELGAADLVLTGRFAPEEERRYRHVPFRVPAGVGQIHLRCRYNDAIGSDPLLRGGNTLDVGLFDERGIEPGGAGFRGWSGSARSELTVGGDWATPPYRAGAIGCGTWHVLLGPYKVGRGGLDYGVEIWFDPGLVAEPAAPRPVTAERQGLTPAAEPGWLRGELHCHTLRSDGDSSPAEVLAAAEAAGLDFVAFTDHNTPAATEGDAGRPIVVPGIEVTTYGGHWNAWGTEGWFEFREPTLEATAAAMRTAVEAGATVAINHPKPFGPEWGYGDGLPFHAIEVWNGPWERLNGRALARWEALLRRGERVVAVGGSDTHRLRSDDAGALADPRLGHPTTWVRVEGTADVAAILAAIRAGRCFLSAAPSGPELYLERRGEGVRARTVGAEGAALMLVGEGGCVGAFAVTERDQEWRLPFPSGTRFVRAHLVDGTGGMLAIANPLWATGEGDGC